jgi:hypothetical protein
VFQNKVLRRRILSSKSEEVTEELKIHNQKLYNLYSSINNIRLIKSRRMIWTAIQNFGRKTRSEDGTWENYVIWENNMKTDLGETV